MNDADIAIKKEQQNNMWENLEKAKIVQVQVVCPAFLVLYKISLFPFWFTS